MNFATKKKIFTRSTKNNNKYQNSSNVTKTNSYFFFSLKKGLRTIFLKCKQNFTIFGQILRQNEGENNEFYAEFFTFFVKKFVKLKESTHCLVKK